MHAEIIHNILSVKYLPKGFSGDIGVEKFLKFLYFMIFDHDEMNEIRVIDLLRFNRLAFHMADYVNCIFTHIYILHCFYFEAFTSRSERLTESKEQAVLVLSLPVVQSKHNIIVYRYANSPAEAPQYFIRYAVARITFIDKTNA